VRLRFLPSARLSSDFWLWQASFGTDGDRGQHPAVDVPEEFKAAGLNKLSSEELQKLDAWLQGYRETTEKTTEKKVEKKVKRSFFTGEPIVSRVDGSFGGLKGRTLIKLEDGTVWKQANIDDHYGPSPIEHPGAAVIHTALGYKIRIQGVPEFYVNPVSTH
jgi:hypothetical protein